MLSRKPRKPPPTQADPDGYRPPKGTIAKVIDNDDEKPIFDKGTVAERAAWRQESSLSKADLRDQLRSAAANTAPTPED
jgi:hypothetical protein